MKERAKSMAAAAIEGREFKVVFLGILKSIVAISEAPVMRD